MSDDRGDTAMHEAAYRGYLEVVQLLLQYGGNTSELSLRALPEEVLDVRRGEDCSAPIAT
jgi:ankyrin repeat protein